MIANNNSIRSFIQFIHRLISDALYNCEQTDVSFIPGTVTKIRIASIGIIISKYPCCKSTQQKAWCDMAEIKATPTLLLNGYKLPHAYKVNDLKYMLG